MNKHENDLNRDRFNNWRECLEKFKSKPLKPFATNLALYLSIERSTFSLTLNTKVVKIEILLKTGKKHVNRKSEDRNTDCKILQML